MANTITGRVYSVGQTLSIPSKSGGQPFLKRDLVLDATRYDPYTGEKGFENYPLLEFTGEKCKELDGLQVGSVVTVSFDLQGGFFDAQDGTKKNFTRVRGYKIEVKGVPVAVQQQPMQQVQQAQPMQPQQMAQPKQPMPQQGYPLQGSLLPPPPPPGRGDLPF